MTPRRRILIVGEGRETEYNYFVGLRNGMEDRLIDTATSVIVKRGGGGGPKSIVAKAILEARWFKPNPTRGDRVFLLMDSEDPGRQKLVNEVRDEATKHGIELILSTPSFEYWLLCHFPKVSRGFIKAANDATAQLKNKWRDVCKSDYDKTDLDLFDRVSDRLELACRQALATDLHHLQSHNEAVGVNPSTQVYELIALLIGARAGEKCPRSGTWKAVSNRDVSVKLTKGEKMPHHQNEQVLWSVDC